MRLPCRNAWSRDPAKSADVGEALLLLAQAQRVNGQASASYQPPDARLRASQADLATRIR